MSRLLHVLNRGVDKRKIFIDDKDYFRFIHDLYEFNDINNVNTTFYKFKKIKNGNIENKKARKLLVYIYAYCLMPNHYHLLLEEKVENGISLFMKKLNMGYARYFNLKYDRSGALFQGKYKAVAIRDDSHFIYIPYYIHANPLDIEFSEWRDRKLKNTKDALDFLNNYRWSSHLDYIGIKNFPSLIKTDFLNEVFGGEEGYKKKIKQWLKDLNFNNSINLE